MKKSICWKQHKVKVSANIMYNLYVDCYNANSDKLIPKLILTNSWSNI